MLWRAVCCKSTTLPSDAVASHNSRLSPRPPDGGEGIAPSWLGNRRWLFSRAPFHHLIVRNAFCDSTSQGLAAEFARLVALGLSERPCVGRFARNIPGYDAYALAFPSRLRGPFEVFHSRAFHDLIANVMGVAATGDVNGGLHHHPPASASGRPHNDLNPGYFIDAPRPDGVNPSDDTRCSYTTGRALNGLRVRETVRAIAIIYYLHNGQWAQGDGGETALYRHEGEEFVPTAMVPPVDNSLLIFECTPTSFHSFVTNHHRPRNSAILWLHRPRAAAVQRWGGESIVRWPIR